MDKHTSGPCELEYDEQNGEFRLMLDTAIQSPGFHHVAHRIELYRDVYPDVGGNDPAQSNLYDEAMANSCRIEAMWNACEGISTKALEAGVIPELVSFLALIRPNEHAASLGIYKNMRDSPQEAMSRSISYADAARIQRVIDLLKGGA